MFFGKINRQAAKLLEMPADTALGLPKIVINGREELFCGGFGGIRLYTEAEVRFVSGGGITAVRGSRLTVKSVDENEITISGDISAVEFI